MSLVTIVLPSVVNPKGRGERLKAIADTWGPSARAVFVVHADEELPLPDSISWIDFDLSKFDMGSTTYPAVLRLRCYHCQARSGTVDLCVESIAI